jgi:hypothetical protein
MNQPVNPEVRCPVCLDANFETISPGRFRCTSNVVLDAVPPGMGGNVGVTPIPLSGSCETLFDTQAGVAAAARHAQARAAAERDRKEKAEDAARRAAEQEDLQERKASALARLKAAGNPGLVQRRVPGRYHLSFSARIFGKVGEDRPVDVEPAWPVGSCTWVRSGSHGVDNFEELETGFTPTGRIVPMEYKTQGDEVEILYRKRRLGSSGIENSGPSLQDIVTALERCLNDGHSYGNRCSHLAADRYVRGLR